MDENQAQVAGRVTIDDVRGALAGTDPNEIGAGKVRTLLGGRGSLETIQKHLITLREELIAVTPPVNTIPALPSEAQAAVQAMWSAAWSAVQLQSLRRTEALAAERDAAMQRVRSMTHDAEEQSETVYQMATQLEQAASDAAVAQDAHKEAQAAAAAQVAQLTQELAAVQAAATVAAQAAAVELAKVRADATHAAEIAQQSREMMRQELERLTDQVGELKSRLYERAKT